MRAVGPKLSVAWMLAVSLWSCGGGGREPSMSPQPAEWTLAPEPSVTIGQLEGEPESELFQVSTAVLLPEGRVAVADQGGTVIRIFRADGTFEREMGRRGRGPGEFMAINRLSTISPDTILAYDRGLFRVTTYLASGRPISSVQIVPEDGSPELFLGRYSTGEFAFSWISQVVSEAHKGRADLMRITRVGANGHVVARLGTMTGLIRNESSPMAFSPHFEAGMIGDSLVLTNGLLPELEVWDPEGVLVRTIAVPAPEIDPAAAWEALSEEIATRGSKWQRQWLEEQPRDHGEVPRLSTMRIDSAHRIWIKLYDPLTDNALTGRRRGGTWWIMDADGRVLAALRLPEGFEMLDARDGRVLEKWVDDLGVEHLRVYDVISG